MSTTTVTPSQDDEKPPVNIGLLSFQEKQDLMAADMASVLSGFTIDAAELPFTPAKSFHISAEGIPIPRVPAPPSELVTTITSSDGTTAYLSTREKRSSGNCVLTDALGHELISTEYFFGPGKDPVLGRLDAGSGEDNTVRTVSQWTSLWQRFLLHDGRTFERKYKNDKAFGGRRKRGTALVLTMNGKTIAALVRNDGTRTPESKSSSAGNGGELLLGEEVGGQEGIAEELVIATVLLMLKKEIDRRRTVQFLVIREQELERRHFS